MIELQKENQKLSSKCLAAALNKSNISVPEEADQRLLRQYCVPRVKQGDVSKSSDQLFEGMSYAELLGQAVQH